MNISKKGLLSRMFMIAGISFAGMSTLRWALIYDDLSQAFFGVMLGAGIFFAGWVHGMFKTQGAHLDSLQNQADTIGSFATGNSKEAEREAMLGQ